MLVIDTMYQYRKFSIDTKLELLFLIIIKIIKSFQFFFLNKAKQMIVQNYGSYNNNLMKQLENIRTIIILNIKKNTLVLFQLILYNRMNVYLHYLKRYYYNSNEKKINIEFHIQRIIYLNELFI